jgi:hypothetical protein
VKTAGWLLVALVIYLVLSWAGVAASRAVASPCELKIDNEVLGNYLQTLGTLYAVLLAFVVFVVWNQYNDARLAVEAEANEVADLLRMVQSFAAPVRERVRVALHSYVQAVVNEEWNAMGSGRVSPKAEALLEEVWQGVGSIEPQTAREEGLFAEALSRFNGLSDSRTDRILTSRLRLPPMMWVLLAVGGLLTVWSMLYYLQKAWPLIKEKAGMLP